MDACAPEDGSPAVVTRHGGVLLARMDAVVYRNALSVEMKRSLAGAAQHYADDASLRCLVRTGTDAVLCAAGDLRGMADEPSAQAIRTRNAVFGTEDFMEGTGAFNQKRPPVFSGR